MLVVCLMERRPRSCKPLYWSAASDGYKGRGVDVERRAEVRTAVARDRSVGGAGRRRRERRGGKREQRGRGEEAATTEEGLHRGRGEERGDAARGGGSHCRTRGD